MTDFTPDLFDHVAEPKAHERYPHVPAARRTDTSRDAAASVQSKAATLRDNALRSIKRAGESGMTADEVAADLEESILSIRPRVAELRTLRQIVDSGTRRANASQRMAIVWVVAP